MNDHPVVARPAGDNPGMEVYHRPAENVSSATMVQFVALPARTKFTVQYSEDAALELGS